MQNASIHILHTPIYRAALQWLADGARHHARRTLQAFETWQRRRAEHAALRQLGELDDHLLHDLGIDRSELLSITANPGDRTRRRAVLR